MFLLVKNRKNRKTRKAINSSKRESYIEYICSWVETCVCPFRDRIGATLMIKLKRDKNYKKRIAKKG